MLHTLKQFLVKAACQRNKNLTLTDARIEKKKKKQLGVH